MKYVSLWPAPWIIYNCLGSFADSNTFIAPSRGTVLSLSPWIISTGFVILCKFSIVLYWVFKNLLIGKKGYGYLKNRVKNANFITDYIELVGKDFSFEVTFILERALYNVSITSDDFPPPDTPVMLMNFLRGKLTFKFLRLFFFK